VLPAGQQRSLDLIELYVVTQFASVLFIRFDAAKQCILDPIKVNLKIKDLLNYKVDRIRVSECMNVSAGGPGLTMLISEHSLLCQIRIQDEP